MPVIKPKIRGFVCITAHPEGCAKNVQEQIDYFKKQPEVANKPKNVLVVGSSTGYGLASSIAASVGCGANTVNIFFERPPANGKPGSAGWYNSVALEEAALEAGLTWKHINGDAFSDDVKAQAIQAIKEDLGPIDLVVYSLASPRRTNPRTGETLKSTLKPIGKPFHGKTLDTDKQLITDVTIEPASQEEIDATIKVMGGEDWQWWIDTLAEENLLAQGAQTVAYSYIGPEVTWAIYKNGTIGKAKEDLERACAEINQKLKDSVGGRAFVSVNKALVTQASSAIPVVPLYNSILFKIMKENGTHEGCIEQIYRLFANNLYADSQNLDEAGRIRIDDLEMKPEVQDKVKEIWPTITTENLAQLADFPGYQSDFLRLFGFGLDGVDYEADIPVERDFKTPSKV